MTIDEVQHHPFGVPPADPPAFAWELATRLPHEWTSPDNLPELQEFERLMREAERALAPPPGIGPWSRMVEAVYALVAASFESGCRFGAAAEGLRRALPGPDPTSHRH